MEPVFISNRGRLKRKMAHRVMGILLSAAVAFNMLPAGGFAAHASEGKTGLCEHHTVHTDDCGYQEETPGTPCTYVCEICNPQDSGEAGREPETGIIKQEHCTCLTLCTEGQINPDCPICGAEDFDLSDCKGKAAKEDTKQPEDTGICKHHQEHDDACGYQPESEDSEGSPCTYECRICPIENLIAALPDVADITEDNAEDVRAQLDEILALYRELTEDEQEQTELSRCYELQGVLDGANVPAPVAEGTPDLELLGQKVCSGDSGDGWRYEDGVLTLENFHSDNSNENFIHVTNADLDFTLYVKGDNSVKTSGKLIWGSIFGSMTITGEQGASLSLDGNRWLDRYLYIRGVNMDVTTQDIIFLSYDMEIDNATVSFNMNGSSGYIYTTHGGFTIKNGSDVTITNSSGAADYCVATNKTEITDSTLKITNPSGFGMYVTKISAQVSEYKASITNSAISASASDAGIHCEDEASVVNSQITNSGQLLLRSKKTITVDDSSTMEGITCAFFNSGAGAAYQVYGSHTLAADLTVAENGSFAIPEGAALTIPDSVTLENNGTMHIHEKDSLTGTGTLTGNGKFLIDVNEDMISVPEGLVYTGKDYTDQIILEENATVCGVEFTADTEGWTRNIEPAVVKDAGEYTVTFTKGDKEISKTFTVAQSGTQFAGDGVVKTYKGSVVCSDFTADDTITVKATPTATGEASAKAATRLRADPVAGEMAVYVGDTQVSIPAGVGADGSYIMTVSAADVLEQGNVEPNGDPVTLTAKFVGNNNMADATGTVNVNISAAAKVVNGGSTTYVGNLADAFKSENDGAIITLLDNVKITKSIDISAGSFTLDLNGYTVSSTAAQTYYVISGNITIKDSGTGGKIQCEGNGIEIRGGTVSVESGTVSGYCGVEIRGGTAAISGDAVISGSDTGLRVTNAGKATLSGGTFSGVAAITANNNGSVTLKNLLAEGYAYHRNNLPVTKAEGWVDSNTWGEVSLDTKATLTGTVTVQECRHNGEGVCEYTHATGTTTHQKTCIACGLVESAEKCSFSEIGKCSFCDAVLAVELPADLALTYTGTAQIPAVTVTVDGTELAAANNYTVTYVNNINAGDTAKATVTGTSFIGIFTLPFTIKPATPTLVWESTTQELTYTGNEAAVTAPDVTLVNGETYSDTISYSYAVSGSDSYTAGLPITAGTYTLKAHVEAKGNYAAADSTNTLKLTIKQAEGTLTVPEAQVSKKFGDVAFSLNCSTNGDGIISYVPSNENVVSVSTDGNVSIKGAGEAVITVSLGDGKNYTGGAAETIRITVAKAAPPKGISETRNYTYTNGSKGAVTIEVAGKLPKDRGETKYTFTETDESGILSDVSVDGNGNLTFTVPGNKSEGDTASITVTAEMVNYENAAYTVEIVLVAKKTVEPQAGSSVSIKGSNILTYGQALSDLTLDSVIFVEQGTDKEVKGSLAWKNPDEVPAVADRTAEWVFTPEDTGEYMELTGTVNITVAEAAPEVEAPKADEVTYHPSTTLGNVGLTGGSATWTAGGSTVTVEGTWAWKDTQTVPEAGNCGYTAVFTPKDAANYKTVECTVAVAVEKAAPHIAVLPTAAQITYGDVLDVSALSGGAVQYSEDDSTAVPGSFVWKDGSIKPAVSDSGSTRYAVVFIPADGINYSSVETVVTLVIGQAENAPGMPPESMKVARRYEKVGSVPLPEGWQWQETDRDTALETGVPVIATAVYNGEDRENYKNVSVAVAITRSECDHKNTELRNAAAATCQKKGYSGDTYCLDCGELLAKGAETDLADHSGGTATCVSGRVCTVCGTEYGAKDSTSHAHKVIRGQRDASCTADGHTGDEFCTDCGAKTGSGAVIAATGHDWRVTREEPATTSSEGKRYYACSKCGQTREEAIPKLPGPSHTHSYSARETKAATCTENGVITYSCSCGDSYTQNTAALGHDYRSRVTKEPTRTEEGVRTYTCTRCQSTYTEGIPKLPSEDHKHDYNVMVVKEAACAEAGVKRYACACGDSYTESIPALGHSYISKVTQEPTVSAEGMMAYTCTRCGDNYTKPIDRLVDTSSGPGSRPESGKPFIKGEPGKEGWKVIKEETDNAGDRDTVTVDMNGTTVVPGDVLEHIRGRDVIIVFDMGDGIAWSVDGKSVKDGEVRDIDFSVRTGTEGIPEDKVDSIAGEKYSIQISLAHEGEFGFTAVLSLDLGRENAGLYARLFYYNESTGELETAARAEKIAGDGRVSLAFTHASEYVIVVDTGEGNPAEEGAEDVSSGAPAESAGTDAGNKSPQTGQIGQPWEPWWIIVVGALVVIIGIGTFFLVRKKKEEI